MKRIVLAVALVFSLSSLACHPRMIGAMAGAAIVAAAIVGTAAVLSYHDGHYHAEYCGHERRWHGGRWVYYYGGHWEYHDPEAGAWYYYREEY
ncbi:MAG: hypothetical protein IT371_24250 [Deltaproteobacteria bacterium]|nr:hypothetical protein [Deltaproteobacteria bacterium]